MGIDTGRMQEDSFPAAERILSDIESVFLKDPELKEFDILPVTVNKNKSPVHHVENCLGLELWCVRHVYCYAYHHLFDMRQQKNRRADPEVQARLLMGALLLNPDVQTFWNMRRELVQSCRLDCHHELHFTAVVLSRKPKCAEAFSYRKWIVAKLVAGSGKEPSLLMKEVEVARAAANRYANNYHAWQHCVWSLSHLAPSDVCAQLYFEEWEASKMWVMMHISDHSGWQYRQNLLQQLCGPLIDKVPLTLFEDHLYEYLHFIPQSISVMKNVDNLESLPTKVPQESDQTLQQSLSENIVPDSKECFGLSVLRCLNIVLSEVNLSTDLITRYPGHEALWYHRRFLLSFMKSLLEQSKCNAHENSGGSSKKSDYFRNKDMLWSMNLDSYNSEAECSTVQSSESKISEMTLSTDPRNVYERASEILKLVTEALPRHEKRLLSSCSGADSNQQRFCSQYNKWLVQVLGLSIAF